MQVKVCGLKTADQVESCIEHGADFCGFILNYKKSHRFIDYQTAEHLTKINKKNTSYVGVLVNPTIDEIEKFSNLNLDYFQLYGNYSNNELIKIKEKYGKKIIAAVQVKKKEDIDQYKVIDTGSDIILWDSSGSVSYTHLRAHET